MNQLTQSSASPSHASEESTPPLGIRLRTETELARAPGAETIKGDSGRSEPNVAKTTRD